MRSSLLVLVLVVTSLAPALPAHAQAAGTPRERAVALFAQSVTAYREGRFDDAAALLDEAYALTPEPVLLYNLGRAREGAGDDVGAAEAYRRYLETATEGTADASAARARLTVLDRRIEERRALEARVTETETQHVVEPPPPPPPAPHEVSVVPWAIAGGGAVVLIVGGVLGALMLDRSGVAQNAPIQADAAAAQSQAETYAIAADVLYGLGGLALGAGLVWGIVDLTSSPSPSATAHLRIGPGGLSLAGTF